MGAPGPRPRDEFLRYYTAGRSPVIYVIEAGSNIKVGKAQCAVSRLKSLHSYLRADGVEIGRFTVFPQSCAGWRLFHIEADCIRALESVASLVPGRREFFAGIDYDTALSVVREALAETV